MRLKACGVARFAISAYQYPNKFWGVGAESGQPCCGGRDSCVRGSFVCVLTTPILPITVVIPSTTKNEFTPGRTDYETSCHIDCDGVDWLVSGQPRRAH